VARNDGQKQDTVSYHGTDTIDPGAILRPVASNGRRSAQVTNALEGINSVTR